MTERNRGTQVGRTTANLVVLGFFFLLRVGEYTKGPAERQTVSLRKGDITLWQGERKIPSNASAAVRSTATAVSICLENQKNGRKGATLHHESSGDPDFDPVKAAAEILDHLNDQPEEQHISAVVSRTGATRLVTSAGIRKAIRTGAVLDGLLEKGFSLDRIGSHSLRSGGAVHLRLMGYDELTIKKLGRWSSNTYLIYIQAQVASLTAGVAARMARPLSFYVVG